MKKADVVVIGGSAAGPVAGISCRRRYPEKGVVLIRKEEQVLVPCGIPYIFGTIGAPEKNLIPDALLDKNGIELVKGEAVDIDRGEKEHFLSWRRRGQLRQACFGYRLFAGSFAYSRFRQGECLYCKEGCCLSEEHVRCDGRC